MNSEDWRDYATALDDAANGLEAFTRRLATAAGEFEPFDPGEGLSGLRTLRRAHVKLVDGLREQARQAVIKADRKGSK